MPSDHHQLKRALGFPALAIYGIGDILGAGIYALVGQIAGLAGTLSWLSFLVAMTVAGLTAMSYPELSRRFPRSGGASWFVQRAFGREEPALLVGWLVLCSGVVSMATVSRAFAGYLQGLRPDLPAWPLILGFFFVLTLINFWGIQLSSKANIVCTTVEVSGLLIVIVAGILFLTGGPAPVQGQAGAPHGPASLAVLQGGALAFFAFIGFEDLVNVAEEVENPERNVPAAIFAALGCAALVYIVVVVISVSVIAPERLAASSAPLLDVVRRVAPAIPGALFTLIALFAVSNTALLNYIMGSRLVYGMAHQRLLPRWLGAVHPTRRTPYAAILVILVIALVLALSGTLVFLAGTTSVLLLAVFFAVHLALIVVRRKEGMLRSGFRAPTIVPVLGMATTVGLAVFVPRQSFIPAGILLATGLAIVGVHWFMRRK